MSGKKKIQVISFQSLSANSGAGMARLGYFLSRELQKRGLLKNFIVHSKGKFQTPFPSRPVSFFSRYYLFVLNTVNRYALIPVHKFRLLQEKLFDWFCSFRIEKDTTIIFTTNAFLQHTFKKAKRLGIFIVLLPGTPEENYICDLVTEENEKMQITAVDAYTYKARLDYFNQSLPYIDMVIGSLPTVYTSYTNSQAYKGKVVRLLGHMTPDFKSTEIKTKINDPNSYKVGFLAHTVILKGLHYLVEAWQDIMKDPANLNMTLYIAGNLEPVIWNYINSRFQPLKNVETIGHITDVSAFMQTLDLFVVPSLVDGAPITALEAAHNAVPVVITDNCGSAELLSRGAGGCWTVPIRDAAAIKEKILWAFHHREEAIIVGQNAKKNMDGYSMEDFIVEIADYLEHKV